MRVNLAEFARCYSVLDQAGEPLVKRAEVFADDPLDLGSLHHFSLNQPRVVRVRSKKIKIAVHPHNQAIARVRLGRCRAKRDVAKLPQEIFHHGAMQAPLVPEVIVEHGLIGMGGGGDFFGSRAGHALRGKVLFRRGQDAARGQRVFNFFASCSHLSFALFKNGFLN